MAERTSMNPDVVYGYCGCGNPIYHRDDYCSTCDTLLNEGKAKEVLSKLRSHVDILTGKIYNQTLEDSV